MSSAMPAVSHTIDLRPVVGARILVADDYPINRALASRVLEQAGATVATAEDGIAVVDLVRESFASDQPFDLVLMDMCMPNIDGFEATRQVRKLGFEGPIVAVSASTDRQSCLAAGCNDFLGKPYDRLSFLEKAALWLSALQRST